ncbi:phage antirepressor KilAC domain-containing protein [Terrisporobacter vanillatitrophus]|uniref:phage antirepressor KilAC domain-containing protein n=1 Tax=Terrisporobacter vanillatitrophus TaxID=3058402 RepID=UPI0033693765
MKLRAKNYTEFMGVKVPNLEGAFGEGKRCVLVKSVAQIHKVELKEINRLINSNIDEFEIGIDIIDLKIVVGSNHHKLELLGFSKMGISKANNIYLLSEQGYMALIQLMRTDKAKEIRKEFRRQYFEMREQINNQEQEKAKLLLSIYNGGQEGVIASKQLTEIETIPLLEKIQEQEPKVEIYERFIDNGKNIDFSLLAKTLGTGRNRLMQMLRNLEILQEDEFLSKGVKFYGAKHNIPEQRYIDKGYFTVKQKELKNGDYKPVTLITPKGQEYIYNKLSKEGII